MLGRGGRERGYESLCVYFGHFGWREIRGHLVMWSIQSKHSIFILFYFLKFFFLDCVRNEIVGSFYVCDEFC